MLTCMVEAISASVAGPRPPPWVTLQPAAPGDLQRSPFAQCLQSTPKAPDGGTLSVAGCCKWASVKHTQHWGVRLHAYAAREGAGAGAGAQAMVALFLARRAMCW